MSQTTTISGPTPRRRSVNNRPVQVILLAGAVLLPGLLAGCHSAFTRLQAWRPSGPVRRITWKNPPFAAASQSPNETARYVYMANYRRVWRKSQSVLRHFGWRINEHDYRLGVIVTHPMFASQLLEPWERNQTSIRTALNNTINFERYIARIKICRAARKGFLQISVQVRVQQMTNPTGATGGPAFAEGSGFGADPLPLQSSYVGMHARAAQWYTIGRNVALEHKILNALFRKI